MNLGLVSAGSANAGKRLEYRSELSKLRSFRTHPCHLAIANGVLGNKAEESQVRGARAHAKCPPARPWAGGSVRLAKNRRLGDNTSRRIAGDVLPRSRCSGPD